ncbi:hypothetical protein BHE74_00021682, partial [Ensete ventricosum]
NPSLESCVVLTLGIRATFLAPRCPSTAIHHLPSNSHNCCDHRRLCHHHYCRINRIFAIISSVFLSIYYCHIHLRILHRLVFPYQWILIEFFFKSLT